MAKRKYDKFFTTDILHKSGYPPFKDMLLYILAKGVDFQIRFTHVSVPYDGMEKPHKHDFDQVMLFVPCTDDFKAYDAESELYLGDEGERHVINKTTALYVPAGLTHCPLNHTRVGTPFFFVNIPLTPEYGIIKDGKKVAIPAPDGKMVKAKELPKL
jgi:hypothetical protein